MALNLQMMAEEQRTMSLDLRTQARLTTCVEEMNWLKVSFVKIASWLEGHTVRQIPTCMHACMHACVHACLHVL